ncbi:MAG: head-tail connector protein [Oscillospiraceae bacterium]|jgi:hypothetical protein|nr:head-tail connector protein [Oscillospiraceae bacterium]
MGVISQQIIFDAREVLRIRHSSFDGEIADLIAAAKADLILGGVLPDKVENETDPLIRRAIMCYVKAEFGLDSADAVKYRESYNLQRQALMLSSDYLGSE